MGNAIAHENHLYLKNGCKQMVFSLLEESAQKRGPALDIRTSGFEKGVSI